MAAGSLKNRILSNAPRFKFHLFSLDLIVADPQMDFLLTENHSCKKVKWQCIIILANDLNVWSRNCCRHIMTPEQSEKKLLRKAMLLSVAKIQELELPWEWFKYSQIAKDRKIFVCQWGHSLRKWKSLVFHLPQEHCSCNSYILDIICGCSLLKK